MSNLLDQGDWPTFGWVSDVRAALAEALAMGEPCVLATLYRVDGSAPRGAGTQMLFFRTEIQTARPLRTPRYRMHAFGYFTGDCIEGDVAGHAARVLETGDPCRLHYGAGSPWIDIRLRCGGALHVFLERITPDSEAAADLVDAARLRRSVVWQSDGVSQTVQDAAGPLLAYAEEPFAIARRYDPPRRLIVSGGDPGALAVAYLGGESQFETILIRPDGPQSPPPFAVTQYLRETPIEALDRIGLDRWTAYLGATHEDEHDLPACLAALRGGAGYVAMIGARSRAEGRIATLKGMGATPEELSRLHLSPGVTGLGKAPWEVATSVMAEIMQALNPARENA